MAPNGNRIIICSKQTRGHRQQLATRFGVSLGANEAGNERWHSNRFDNFGYLLNYIKLNNYNDPKIRARK